LIRAANPLHRLSTPGARLAAVLIAAAALAATLVGASVLGGRGATAATPGTPSPTTSTTAAERSLFAGVPQRGSALGSPTAPLTLIEYADLQCPYCAQWALGALPTVVDRYVRTGKLRIVFSGMAFVGPDSRTGLETAIVAGRSNRLWDVVHGLYAAQGAENSGWLTDAVITEVAASVPGLDGSHLIDSRSARWVETELQRVLAVAQAAGVNSTPTFQLGRTGGPFELVHVSSLDPGGITPAIDAALAG
jgi:protein-disulfide isomerase